MDRGVEEAIRQARGAGSTQVFAHLAFIIACAQLIRGDERFADMAAGRLTARSSATAEAVTLS